MTEATPTPPTTPPSTSPQSTTPPPTTPEDQSDPNNPSGAPPSNSPGGAIALLILGLLCLLVGVGPLVGGATLGGVLAQQDADGFVSSPAVPIAADSYALTSPDVTVASDVPQLPLDVGTVRLSATGRSDTELFIGLARQADVDAYLDGVHYTEVADVRLAPQSTRLRDHPGGVTPDLPGNQDFWIESDTGVGVVELQRRVEFGDWAVVVMNADATPGVQVLLQAGIRSDWFGPLAAGLFLFGFVLCLVGIPLVIFGVIGIGNSLPPGAAPQQSDPYPAHLTGELVGTPSRWLWLVKWLLAIPHYIVLAFLWCAVWIVTIVAWFAILFTGRYPRSLFDFSVGVLRWTWRVTFYSYGVLGTDRYPPFSLSSTNYPADFSIDYPERLSRGLIFVKSWLLALPHLLLVGAVTGSAAIFVWPTQNRNGDWWMRGATGAADWSGFTRIGGISIIGLLVLVAAVSLLFRARYPVALFDLLVGLHRWSFRVVAYVGLFRDEYPPFRLDQGPRATVVHAGAVPSGPVPSGPVPTGTAASDAEGRTPDGRGTPAR